MADNNNTKKRRNTTTETAITTLGRLQPQARELEEAVLGAIMLEKDGYSIVSDLLKPESFYEKAHEKIYAAIVDLATTQRPIDMLTVTEQLRKRGELDEAGGARYIAELTEINALPSTSLMAEVIAES